MSAIWPGHNAVVFGNLSTECATLNHWSIEALQFLRRTSLWITFHHDSRAGGNPQIQFR